MKLDLSVIAARPEDAELGVGGRMLLFRRAGRQVGVLDVTRGEMGTRGTVADRDKETAAASRALDLTLRENLGLHDVRVVPSLEARERLAHRIRDLAPDLVLAHHVEALHPDHAAAGEPARQAWYLSGLSRLAGASGGAPARRPRRLMHYMGHVPFEPTLVVDITPVWEAKCEAVRAYASQLRPANAPDRGQRFLFGADVLGRMETRAHFYGERIGARYGEPLFSRGPFAIDDVASLTSSAPR